MRRFTFNPFAVWLLKPTEEDVLRKQLREAQVDRAEQAKLREYHQAMEKMLTARIARITAELEKTR